MSHLTIGDDVPSFEEKDEQGTVVSSTLLLVKSIFYSVIRKMIRRVVPPKIVV